MSCTRNVHVCALTHLSSTRDVVGGSAVFVKSYIWLLASSMGCSKQRNTMASKSSTESSRGPDYVAPTAGIFRVIPKAWIPYAELMRLDRAAG